MFCTTITKILQRELSAGGGLRAGLHASLSIARSRLPSGLHESLRLMMAAEADRELPGIFPNCDRIYKRNRKSEFSVEGEKRQHRAYAYVKAEDAKLRLL